MDEWGLRVRLDNGKVLQSYRVVVIALANQAVAWPLPKFLR